MSAEDGPFVLTESEKDCLEWASNSSWEAGKIAVLVRLVNHLLDERRAFLAARERKNG